MPQDGKFSKVECVDLVVTGSMRVDLPWGRVVFSNNEVSIVSTVSDPPKLRLSSVDGGGAISFGWLRPDGAEEELVLIQGKRDERTRGESPLPLVGEMTIHVQSRVPGDAGMRKIVGLLSDTPFVGSSDQGDGTTRPPVNGPATGLPGDAFAQQVRAWYRDILRRPTFPYAADDEVDAHRPWLNTPQGIEGLHRMLIEVGPGG